MMNGNAGVGVVSGRASEKKVDPARYLPLGPYDPVRGSPFHVYAGPFAEAKLMPDPDGVHKVCLASELVHLKHDAALPIHDFSVPDPDAAAAVLGDVVARILVGTRVYVGCKAGQGRTGLFLALLAKTFGHTMPVFWVREHYNANAVETRDQHAYVRDWRVPSWVHDSVLEACHRARPMPPVKLTWRERISGVLAR